MVVHRRKKVTKYRGHVTHGGGSRKKRRGAGSRGGRGNAGTGKRAGQKKAGMPLQLGRHGFVHQPYALPPKIINVGDLTWSKVQQWGTQDEDAYTLDLGKQQFGKLLGTGTVTLKLHVIVPRYSAQAEEKIKAAGGSISSSSPLSVGSSPSLSSSSSGEKAKTKRNDKQ